VGQSWTKKHTKALTIADACTIGFPAKGPDGLERLRSACDRRVPLACLYWADAEEKRPGGPQDPDQVRRAYVVACRGTCCSTINAGP
jgi:hypothetical protein